MSANREWYQTEEEKEQTRLKNNADLSLKQKFDEAFALAKMKGNKDIKNENNK